MKWLLLAAYLALIALVVVYLYATIDHEPDDLDAGQE